MEKGKIIEAGTHDQLRVLGGKYARLASHQSLENSDTFVYEPDIL